MVTSDERKRVANELRRYVKKFGTPTWRVLCNIVLGRDSRHSSIRMLHLLDRLADLIDPNCGTAEVGTSQVPECDRGALLALADEIDKCGRIQREKQRCGELWFVDGLDIMDFARRIREACGVEP